MITQYSIDSGRDCDTSTLDFLWLIQILDGGWNEGFKGTLDFYSWHSVSPSRNEKVVMVMYEVDGGVL